jgi:BON domain
MAAVKHAIRERRPAPAAAAALRALPLLLMLATSPAMGEERRNWFNDPFAQATRGLAACPVPEGPLLTEDEMRRQSHQRVERGTSCWLAKKCDEPNAYGDDARLNATVVAALSSDRRLQDTSLWVITQRRFVLVQGCIQNAAQKQVVVDAVRRLPGVEHVVDELLIGTRGGPPYRVSAATSKWN